MTGKPPIACHIRLIKIKILNEQLRTRLAGHRHHCQTAVTIFILFVRIVLCLMRNETG